MCTIHWFLVVRPFPQSISQYRVGQSRFTVVSTWNAEFIVYCVVFIHTLHFHHPEKEPSLSFLPIFYSLPLDSPKVDWDDMFIDLRDEGRGEHRCERELSSCLPYAPQPGIRFGCTEDSATKGWTLLINGITQHVVLVSGCYIFDVHLCFSRCPFSWLYTILTAFIRWCAFGSFPLFSYYQ